MTTKRLLLCGWLILAGVLVLPAAEAEEAKPAPWVGNWRLVSGERAGVKMAESSTGGYFSVTPTIFKSQPTDEAFMSSSFHAPLTNPAKH